jgi:hypothetical protein
MAGATGQPVLLTPLPGACQDGVSACFSDLRLLYSGSGRTALGCHVGSGRNTNRFHCRAGEMSWDLVPVVGPLPPAPLDDRRLGVDTCEKSVDESKIYSFWRKALMLYQRIVFVFLVLILANAFTPTGARAANLVVSPTGSDGGLCTAVAPSGIPCPSHLPEAASQSFRVPTPRRSRSPLRSRSSAGTRRSTRRVLTTASSSRALEPPGPASRGSRSRTPRLRVSWSARRRT